MGHLRGSYYHLLFSLSHPHTFASLSSFSCLGLDSFGYTHQALHSHYLCMKVPATQEVISVHGNQKDARNIEQAFAPGRRNVICLQDEKAESIKSITKNGNEGTFAGRPIEPECETKIVSLDLRVPDKIVMISQDMAPSEVQLIAFLDKNSDMFA
jgi:hypothetical protein